MGLRDDIKANFTDADGLVSPNPCDPSTHNASNNGVCYSGEYITLLALTDLPHEGDLLAYAKVMEACKVPSYLGLINRSPINTKDSESPDDFYGLFSGLYFSGLNSMSRDFLSYGLKHYGSFNNTNPGHFSWATCMYRQPQLLAMNLWSAYPENKLIKILIFPLTLITAIIIATACLGLTQTAGADPWRLTWLLVQVAKRESWLCKLASRLWYRRLDSVWGGMAQVAARYYKGLPGQDHPFVTAFAAVDTMKGSK